MKLINRLFNLNKDKKYLICNLKYSEDLLDARKHQKKSPYTWERYELNKIIDVLRFMLLNFLKVQ